MLFLFIAQEQFKPEYLINDCGVVLNTKIAYECKVNGATYPQVSIKYAETTFGRKLFKSSVDLAIQGYRRPLSDYDLICGRTFSECLNEVIDFVSKSETAKDKKVLQQIHKDLTKTITKWKT